MIELKSPEQIEGIRRASVVLVDIAKRLRSLLRPGIKTIELDKFVQELINSAGAKSAFLGYHGFPKNICVSINEEIVHGIPGDRTLREGDIVSIDIGIIVNGYISDAAFTVGINNITERARKLIDVTREALYKAIDKAREGNRISDISAAIQEHAEASGFSVIREFVGHGTGLKLHEDPQIPNFGQRGMGVRIKEGMVLAIEPMVSAGKWEAEVLSDGWTAVTKDRSPAAHFEHTVAITSKGSEVLTEGIF
jgi:methionyl aminopeptidase